MSHLLCPCCGHRFLFSEEMCHDIQTTIHSYMETTNAYKLFKYRHFLNNGVKMITPGVTNATQMVSVYFIRRMTGAPYKTIAEFINSAISIPARNFNEVVMMANKSREVREVLDEIEFILLGKTENKPEFV